MRLEGKVALVTGAASGIGRATALAFAQEGAKVVAADVLVNDGEETVRLIKEAGGQAIFVKCDVSRRAEVEGLIKKAVETYGVLHCAFNNAGIEGRMALSPDFDEDEWDRIIDVNLKGVWLCLKYELPQMLKQGGGVVVNTASVGGLVGLQGLSPYCASKGGVVQLTRAVALECAQSNIRVNAICPGGIRTPLSMRLAKQPLMGTAQPTPMRRWGEPKEVAEAVVWLCSDASSFVTGHLMAIDGGFVAG